MRSLLIGKDGTNAPRVRLAEGIHCASIYLVHTVNTVRRQLVAPAASPADASRSACWTAARTLAD